VEPITRTVIVRSSVERAFEVFSERMGAWWPLETHSVAVDQGLDQRAVTLKVGARQGGRIEEVLEDGSTLSWGGIEAWEPPNRVVIWWKPNELPTPPTMVEVRFTAEGEMTRVDVEHRGWERLGEAAADIYPLYSSEGGWTLVLGRYTELVES
jgi:Activator of Hsp90 ATPase homolog 1-like protein